MSTTISPVTLVAEAAVNSAIDRGAPPANAGPQTGTPAGIVRGVTMSKVMATAVPLRDTGSISNAVPTRIVIRNAAEILRPGLNSEMRATG